MRCPATLSFTPHNFSALKILTLILIHSVCSAIFAQSDSTSFDSWATATQLGGRVTVLAFGEMAFTKSYPELTYHQREKVALGRTIFNKRWDETEGLGPFFNADSCASCHPRNGKGRTPVDEKEGLGGMVLRLTSRTTLSGHPVYGSQLRPFATKNAQPYGTARVGWIQKRSSLLQEPLVQFLRLTAGPIGPETTVSLRAAPALIGLGILEAVPDEEIDLIASTRRHAEFGIYGRSNKVWDSHMKAYRTGRFGWKASHASIRAQIVSALADDMGISSPEGGSLPSEITDAEIDALVLYVRTLAVPARQPLSDPEVRRGARIFDEAHCSRCHRPSFFTAETVDHVFEADQIFPFTDLLLHDMGDGLADKNSFDREWKTPPLWGLGLMGAVGEANYLHDGRARSLAEAILWHGGEGDTSRKAFNALSVRDRNALLKFLESL